VSGPDVAAGFAHFASSWALAGRDRAAGRDLLCSSAGFSPGSSSYWCGMGAAGILAAAGLGQATSLRKALLHTANVAYLLSNGREGVLNRARYPGPAAGRFYVPWADRPARLLPLDIIIFRWPGVTGARQIDWVHGHHIALLAAVGGGLVITIEGNGSGITGSGKKGAGTVVIRATPVDSPALFRVGRLADSDFTGGTDNGHK
jgi:hypothetical protein